MAPKAVCYLRVSGKGQVQGGGFPRQRAACQRYAKAHGLELVGEYRDEGVSGTKELEDREGLSDLMAHIRSNGVKVVLVERADRLARDLMVSELILSEFRKLDVRVVAAEGGADLTAGDDDPTAKLIRQVLGAVAEFEKSILISKLKAGRIRKAKKGGRSVGRHGYGEKPGEAEIVSRIRALRRKRKGAPRLSYAKIATQLNAEGVPTRMGKPWRPSSVESVLIRAPRPGLVRRK